MELNLADIPDKTQDVFTATVNAFAETVRRQSDQITALLRNQEEQTQTIKRLEAQLAWFQNRYFGKSSEKHSPLPDQPGLFDEFEFKADKAQPEETKAEQPVPLSADSAADAVRKRRESRLRAMMDRLPVLEREVVEPEGGVDLTRYRRIGEEVTRTIECRPGQLYVKETIRPKYGLIDPSEPVAKGRGVLIAPCPCFPYTRAYPVQVC